MCISQCFWCSVFFSENSSAAVVPSPKNGNTSNSPGRMCWFSSFAP